MEVTNTKLLRFTIPPALLFLFIYIPILSKNFKDFSFLEFPFSGGAGNIVLGGTAGVIALGFIISTIPIAVWRLLSISEWSKPRLEAVVDLIRLTSRPKWHTGKICQDLAKSKFCFSDAEKINNTAEAEALEWCIHSEKSDYIREKIGRKWDMSALNSNSAAAMILGIAFYILIFIKIDLALSWPWILSGAVLFFVWSNNGRLIRDDINAINCFLLKNDNRVATKGKFKKNKQNIIKAQRDEKEENLGKIREFVRGRESVSNNEVEKLLGVSDATAERYLDALEKEGLIRQVGDTGSGVRYERLK